MNIIEFLQKKHNIILNEQQQKGVLCLDKNTLLLAVPGSGKTTVLVSRIANLMVNYQINNKQILTLTYSRETAKDMKRRFEYLFSTLALQSPSFKTIHSFCLSVLRYYSQAKNRPMPKLITDSDNNGLKTRLLRELYMHFNEEYLTDDLLETLDRLISYSKNMMLTMEQLTDHENEIRSFQKIYIEYEQYKKQNKLIDYDDMLTLTYEIFIRFPDILNVFQFHYQYINVDEAQDTSLIQHKIIQMLAKNSMIFMVGDEDQSIYSFRGAFPKALLDFDKLYQNSSIIKMEQNFRSNFDIVSHANDFIKQNQQRYQKEMFCNNSNHASIQVVNLRDYADQYKKIIQYIHEYSQNKTLAVVYRNNESAIPLIDLFYRNDIHFYIKEHKLTYFSSFVVRDIISYMLLARNGCDLKAFKQIYYKLGLSKGIYEHVERKLCDFDSVFLCVASIQAISDGRRNQMKYYHSAFQRLYKMPPKKAIAFIMDALGYENYIENRLNDGFTKTNAYQKISTAIHLAEDIDTIESYVDKLNDLQIQINDQINIDSKANITLTTLHSSKGLEFDTVIMLDMIKDIIPSSDAVVNQVNGQLDEIENETRLFYVGVTRAKKKLIFYRSHFLNDVVAYPSRFIERFVNGVPLHTKKDQKKKSILKIEAPNIIGKMVMHSTFGKGIVESQNDDIITIVFQTKGVKNLSYTACINAGLLELTNKER
ncbi:ATP-dependent helicase [Paludicola sp. MB14-C6]|uniref:ATP-dependent helicase n=1 Tax=Paludihabitans sp. MB14-C6 TaxID=3070656 RepID=UPI0027DDE1F7|nr:ATP-dependent helicase [Paludicola sp. MB14-C6]WMJ23432.1 ATP-dependent helicase [Paludicola sp. MB14-C6]